MSRVQQLLRAVGLALSVMLGVSALVSQETLKHLPLGLPCLLFAIIAGLSIARRTQLADLPKPPSVLANVMTLSIPPLVCLLFYRDVLDAWFMADDLIFVVTHQSLDLAGTLEWWYPSRSSEMVQIIRPIAHTCSYILVKLFGLSAFPSHLVNVLLHAMSAVLLARLALRTTGQTAIGLAAGVGFAIQPLAVTTVSWLNTHQDPLAGFFFIASLAALAEANHSVRWARQLSVLAFGFAVLSKESPLCLPLAAAALIIAFDPKARSVRGFTRSIAPHAVLLLVYVAYRLFLFGGPGGYTGSGYSSFLDKRPDTAKSVALQLPEVLLVPANRAIVPNTDALRQAAAAFAILLLTMIVSRPHNSAALLLAATGATIIVASIIPVHNMLWMGPHLTNARYLYLASAGFVLVATGLCFGIQVDPAKTRAAIFTKTVPVAIWLLSFFALALANREQWLSNASIQGGIARDLQALHAHGELERVEFVGFPDFWMGSYTFHLTLVPEVALGQQRPVRVYGTEAEAPQSDASEGIVARYRFLGGERLWQRETPRFNPDIDEDV